MSPQRIKVPGPATMQRSVQDRQKITGSFTWQSREERHAETKKKPYPGVPGTSDECEHPLSSDCDPHADGTSLSES